MEILIPSKLKSIVIFITLFGFYFLPAVNAQSIKLQVESENTSAIPNDIESALEQSYKDSIELKSRLRESIIQLRQKGYLAASFDNLRFSKKGTNAKVSFFPGSRFMWGNFNVTNLPENLKNSNWHRQFKRSALVNLSTFLAYQEYILNSLNNKGYPFAYMQLKNVSFQEDTISADLKIIPGAQYFIDTIFIKGKNPNPVNKRYIFPKLEIFPGMLYDASVISSISSTVHKIPFLQQIKPPEIDFSENNRANLYLYLGKAQSNRISGMVGFLSNDNQSFQLTGSVNLLLRNAFNRGEQFSMQWESFEEKTQQLDLEFSYPYLLFNAIGVGLDGSLLKQDTSYLTTNFRMSLPFHLSQGNTFAIYWKYQGSSVISEFDVNENNIQDFRKSLFGVSFIHNTLDYELNPTQGIMLETQSSLGNKRHNATHSVQLESQLQLSYYQPLFSSFVLKPSLYSGYMKSWTDNNNSQGLSKNELYRIGGNQFLRGFQERRFYASLYSVASLELRYILGTNSNLHLFFDGAYFRNQQVERVNEDFPVGFGLGADLDTGGGIISLSYALGKTSKEPFEIKNAMVHIGYVNKF